jgi:hypothetical protein
MGQERLDGLPITSIENRTAKNINSERTTETFGEIKARKFEF